MFGSLFVDFVQLSPLNFSYAQDTFFFWIVDGFRPGFYTGRAAQDRA